MPDFLQRVLGLLGAIVTLPLVAAFGAAVKLDTPGPALYRAPRVGEGGVPFACLKLRTMVAPPARPLVGRTEAGVTRAADPRITRMGRLLRRYRLDELPQLWNVARGEMRLVGPRPEDPRYVDWALPLHRIVFTKKPGMTGLTQLLYTDEGRILADTAAAGDDPEDAYRRRVLPAKLRIDAAYLRHRSTRLDLWILAQTPNALRGRPIALPDRIATELGLPGYPTAAPIAVPVVRTDTDGSERELVHA